MMYLLSVLTPNHYAEAIPKTLGREKKGEGSTAAGLSTTPIGRYSRKGRTPSLIVTTVAAVTWPPGRHNAGLPWEARAISRFIREFSRY